jgi:hypothetical protein
MRIKSQFNWYPSARWGHTVAVADQTMYIIGGFDGEYLNEIWKFDFREYKMKLVQCPIDADLKRSNQTSVYYPKDKM